MIISKIARATEANPRERASEEFLLVFRPDVASAGGVCGRFADQGSRIFVVLTVPGARTRAPWTKAPRRQKLKGFSTLFLGKK